MNKNPKYLNWTIIVFSSIIILSILWNTFLFVQNFKQEERNKMELWSLATLELVNIKAEISNLTLEVLKKNTTTPMIKIDNNGLIEVNNIPELNLKDTLEIKRLINKFKSENQPIEINLGNEKISTLYYGNSSLLNKLKYYPATLLIIAAIFGFIAFLFFKNSKIAEINKLWSAMAKETAHQIGTPLSSMMGWIELSKVRPERKYLNEIEKDIERLNIISERFSKIGSSPKLINLNISDEIEKTVNYLSARISTNIKLEFIKPKSKIKANINPQLFSWCIENLIKNGIDAIKDSGYIKIRISKDQNNTNIYISDSGIGIPKSSFKKIFNPGFTSKQRGWGLGLSLAKRIIEDYHSGEIRVYKSDKGNGTTMLIKLNSTI
ncbi:MAG: sensor histidine kinase [Flavobacteriaceae bacterium]